MARYNVLFLCTGNSARSILAEALLNRLGNGVFHAFSAGSHPKGTVHPLALETLGQHGIPIARLSSKNWDLFATPDAPAMHFVFTVCDRAAAETCPFWPGQPMSAHWGVADPAAVGGSEEQQHIAFEQAFRELDTRIRRFTSLRLESLDATALKCAIDEIGRTPPE